MSRSQSSTRIAHIITLTNEHFSTLLSNSSPLVQKHRDFTPNIFNNSIHLDIIAIKTKRIFELASNAIDPIEREHDQHHDWHSPPSHVIYKCKGQHTPEESQDLFLVDEMRYRDAREADGFHTAIGIRESVELYLHLRGLWAMKEAFVKEALDILLDEKCKLQWQSYPFMIQARQIPGEELAVFGNHGRVASIRAQSRAGYDLRAPSCSQVVLRSIQDCYQNAYDPFCICSVCLLLCLVLVGYLDAATRKEGASKVADRRDDNSEVVSAIPETIVGCLITENLVGV